MKKPEKESLMASKIIEEIQKFPKNQFKHFIPHWFYIDEHNIGLLIKEGFKVSRGQWDGNFVDVLIIEW